MSPEEDVDGATRTEYGHAAKEIVIPENPVCCGFAVASQLLKVSQGS